MIVWTWLSSNLRPLVGFKPSSLSLSDASIRLHGLLSMMFGFGLGIADVFNSRQEMTSQMRHINVQLALLNGHAYELRSLLPSSWVQVLRMGAQRAFGQKHLRLITGEKRVLVNFEQTLEEAQIKDGECLTVLVLQPQLAATSKAFALWCHGDSAIVTWGGAEFGGDSSAVQDQLRDVQQIQATGGPLLPPPAPRRARRPPGPVLTKVQGAKGRKLTGHSLASCIKTCSAPSGSVLTIAQGVN